LVGDIYFKYLEELFTQLVRHKLHGDLYALLRVDTAFLRNTIEDLRTVEVLNTLQFTNQAEINWETRDVLNLEGFLDAFADYDRAHGEG
jgi:hypothetical protein